MLTYSAEIPRPTGAREETNVINKNVGQLRIVILDFLAIGLTVFLYAAIAAWNRNQELSWLPRDATHVLGAEYYSIASAIHGGYGFGDPFQERSGETAWMPPVLPYFLAFAIWIANDNLEIVRCVMISMHIGAVFASSWIVVRVARKLRLVGIGYGVLVVGLAMNFQELFQRAGDTGLLLFLTCVLWRGILFFWNGCHNRKHAAIWGLGGGVIALSSPALGAVWSALTAWRFWPTIREHTGEQASARLHPFATLTIATITSVVAVSPWIVRNRIMLHSWIPIKSNAMFEFWQSQCFDNGGVLDSRTLFEHPWFNREERRRYIEIGEIAFVGEKASLAKRSIIGNPTDFLVRLMNRGCAAFVFYVDYEAMDTASWLPMLLKKIVFSFPLVSFLLLIATKPAPFEPELTAATAVWILLLIPYVAISYTDRYAAPLVGMKMLIVIFGIHSLKEKRESAPGTNGI